MTETTSDTVAAEAPARSPARAALAARIAARERAHEVIGERQAALRRLTVIAETATALASQLAGVKAAAAATLAEHVLSGASGAPTLASDARTDLVAKLAEAEAKAEASAPAMVQVEAAITRALEDFQAAGVAVVAVTRPALEEEVARTIAEVREAMDRLTPLAERLAGARAYAYAAAHTGEPAQKVAHIALGERIDAAMAALRLDPGMPHGGSDALWSTLSQRLAIDPDAMVA